MANYLPKVKKLNLTKKEDIKEPYDPSKQVEGYKKRIEASGLDANKATDSRNWLEKTLNLTPNQNPLFDVFEILQRPQEAIFGAWKAKQEGGDVKQALKDGISGADVVRFKEILHNYGMKDSAEKIGIDDIAGFLGDVFIDPMDIPLMPITAGAGTIAKLGTKVDKAKDVVRVLDKASDVSKSAQAIKTLKKAENALVAAKKTRLMSPIEGVFRLAKGGIGKTLKFSDNAITKVLQKVDNLSMKSFDLGKTEKALELADSYSNVKKSITQVFAAAKEVPANVMDAYRKNLGKEAWTKRELQIVQDYWYKNDFRKVLTNGDLKGLFTKYGIKSEDDLGSIMQGAIEYSKYKPTFTLDELIVKGGAKDMPINTETKQIIDEFFSAYFPKSDYAKKAWKDLGKINGVDGYQLKDKYIDDLQEKIKYYKDRQVSENAVPGLIDPNAIVETQTITNPMIESLGKTFDNPRFYNKNDIAKYQEMLSNKTFSDAVQRADDLRVGMLNRIDEVFNTKLTQGTPEGVVRHAMTDQRKSLQGKYQLNFEPKAKSQLQGNVNTFTGRKYKMSAEEANWVYDNKIKNALENGNLTDTQREFWQSHEGMKLFETSINSSVADFIDYGTKFAKDAKQLDDVLVTSFMLDPDIIKPLKESGKIENGFTRISKKDLTSKLNGFKNYVSPNVANSFENVMNKLPNSENLMMDNTVFEMIGRLGNEKELSKFVKVLDVVNNSFKKFKLLSPGFQMRNFCGNTSNMYLSGMPILEIVKGIEKSGKVFKQAPDIVKRATIDGVQSLSKADRQIYDMYKEFVENGFHEISKEVWDLEKVIKDNHLQKKRNVVDKLSDANFKKNQKWDEIFRMSAYNYAKKNPEVFRKLNLNNPAEYVRHTLFDPRDLSKYERDVLKRLVPFYTFTKKNLAFQMKNLFDNPRKYNHLRKTIRATWDTFANIDDKDIEAYKKENMWIPVPFVNKDGKYSAIKLNLPVGDLAEFIENPMKKVLASSSPAVRAPFEVATNKQIYTDMPIQEFKGQKGFILPNMDRKSEYLLSQTGLDVPLSFGADVVRGTKKALTGGYKDQSGFDIAREMFGRSIFSQGDVANAQRSKSYQELQQIRELMQYYKQEDISILTLAQAENKKSSISQLGAKLRALR